MTEKGKKTGFAVVGCGHIGKRHAEMITRDEDAELLALCDIRPCEEVGIEAYDVPFFSNIEDLLNAALPIDVVSICTPNGLHAPMAIQAIEAGFHVIIEKPMALNTADAEKVVYTSLKHRKQVFCVMQNRYSPPSVWIKEMVDSGKLGDIYLVQLNCYWNRDERYYKVGGWHGDAALDGGTLFTQFSHFIDIMYYLFGDICDIQAKFADFNHKGLTDFEDSGIVNFRFLNGGLGSLNYSTSVWDKNMESSLLIIAQNGSVKIGGQYMDKVEYCHIKDYKMPELAPTNPGNDYGAYKGSAQNHNFVIRNVVQVLSGSSSEPITTNVLEGMKVVDIIQRIYALK
ncbi:UDP-N-acetyl-2-amino-2-deoxyglucuronate dehydrogenase [Parabacteroides sp. PF5-5]|uniref:Gfo/Idh/MocA family protein n=1 Tax=unclassified Parabacteroides TaxID=2649774 RepID=UPI0024760572|nr:MULTISPECIES: Gfo/Idh/MocA family oxidoreductase [unclassified Parabacteroides]MDH6303569.1 UDP-N-acetyl-2-amino-2-deoxyglucuronate dehydrogenase [Parabacteroides sp. PH5-39]MDH6314891.1 UDP-N-acetyl-2-amino-2-deoxyglucuronate dehydrogenase [Parabacteroides sp. PF5-13]MDH6318228.1 UDP-N-acetyl-2-amino-2-deoxyglucuronate dehydrogenase [Parabacteroides sp. PH5-13]MDH6321839.1 UDP-N-acetyl-2-amino-2-deoxyglucuronate dehydrogenase [Parabacteroides sp. PH5-8]MDH6325963.1 UDP-N-acetyl-2-amino-2-d